MDYENSPDYLKAADIHNIGAGTPSFFDDPLSRIESAASSAVDFVSNIPNFAITSVASGINSIYNSGVHTGNWLGVIDAEESNLQETLNSYDSDLGQYYGAHKSAVDLTGFVAGSFLPGIAGVKLINAGQRVLSGALKTGSVGRTLAESIGVIPTVTAEGKTLIQVAGEALAQGSQTFSWTNTGVIKAVAAGASQAAIDSIGFEALVQATMYRSPILEGQDFTDIGHNLLTAAVFGGAVGGVFNAAGVYGGVKKILTEADARTLPYRRLSATFGMEADQRIVARASDLQLLPAGVDELTTGLVTATRTSAWQDINKSIHELVKAGGAGENTELGNFLSDVTQQVANGDQIARMYGGAKAIYAPGLIKEANEDYTLGYVKLHGEGAGSTTFTPMRAGEWTLADKLKNAQSIDTYVDSIPFGTKKAWSPVTSSGPDEIQARYIWAETKATYTEGMVIGHHDIPLLEGAARKGLTEITIDDGVHSYKLSSVQDIANEVAQAKLELVNELAKSKKAGWGFNAGANPDKNVSTITSSEIARAANVSVEALENNAGASMFARQDALARVNEARVAAGQKPLTDLDHTPQFAAIAYDSSKANTNGDLLSAMVGVEQQKKILSQKGSVAFADIAGEMNSRFSPISNTEMISVNRYGAGAGLITSANGAYDTLASKVELIGKATADLIQQTKRRTLDTVESHAVKLRSDPQAAIEFSKINDLRNSTTEKYILSADGESLVAKKWADYQARVQAGAKNVEVPVLQEGASQSIPFKSPIVRDAVTSDIQANGWRVTKSKGLRAAEGSEDSKDPSIFYGWKPDPDKLPFFAFVKDSTITGEAAGHTSMIHASSAAELESLIQMVKSRTGFSVYTKSEAEEYYRAKNAYKFDKTIHDNYIDSALKSAGVNSNFFPKTNPNSIVDEWLASHARRDAALSRDAVAVKYGPEFDQLAQLGQQYTGIAASRAGSTVKGIESTVQNPYNDYRKTALNISRLSEYPILNSVNRGLENVVDRTMTKIADAFKSVKAASDLPEINRMLEEAGISHSYKNAAEVIFANHTAPTPHLSNFIRGANSVVAATFLKLDFLNPIANAVGAQVLLGAESNSATKALLRDSSVGGVQVPGVSENILSPLKLIARANADFLSRNKEPALQQLTALLEKQGLTVNLRQQMHSMLDDLSLSGTENAAQLQTRLSSALERSKALVETGAKVTGNNFAEYYNRWIAGHVANQISDIRISAGLMQEEGRNAYLNTFVNRTQTNTLASQRPLIFQGPVGQAIGLFQSFQFNTMQQLFRNVSEGSAKDAAMLLGLQGTIFGLNGLPGFQYINQHIVGTASGNPNHTDAYSSLYGAAGKITGDWLMYGIPSNLLQTNLYSRGDINPRQLTVVPVAPQDIVAVSAFGKFAGNLKETFSKMAGGGDIWQTVLQGLEHNSLSRPLAGLAQTLQGTGTSSGQSFSTTGAGDINFVNDIMSLATLSRLAGGKPLDEAIANDQRARAFVYQAADKERMNLATETFKTTLIGAPGAQPTQEALHNYLDDYVRGGGRKEEFNKQILHVLTRVNTPTANQLIFSLKTSPYANTMKDLMGGGVETLQSDSRQ